MQPLWIQLIIAIIVAVVTAWITVFLALNRFRKEKTWEVKFNGYRELFDLLIKIRMGSELFPEKYDNNYIIESFINCMNFGVHLVTEELAVNLLKNGKLLRDGDLSIEERLKVMEDTYEYIIEKAKEDLKLK